MQKFDFNNKTFVLIENSEKGSANSQTIFKYAQEGDLVTVKYYGGPIRSGKIIGRLEGSKLHILYQCLTSDNDLKSGKSVADVYLNENNKLQLKLHWQWLDHSDERGLLEYLEI